MYFSQNNKGFRDKYNYYLILSICSVLYTTGSRLCSWGPTALHFLYVCFIWHTWFSLWSSLLMNWWSVLNKRCRAVGPLEQNWDPQLYSSVRCTYTVIKFTSQSQKGWVIFFYLASYKTNSHCIAPWSIFREKCIYTSITVKGRNAFHAQMMIISSPTQTMTKFKAIVMQNKTKRKAPESTYSGTAFISILYTEFCIHSQ